MPAANASARGQRSAILASPRRELTGFALVVDCRGAGCGGERYYAISRRCLSAVVLMSLPIYHITDADSRQRRHCAARAYAPLVAPAARFRPAQRTIIGQQECQWAQAVSPG